MIEDAISQPNIALAPARRKAPLIAHGPRGNRCPSAVIRRSLADSRTVTRQFGPSSPQNHLRHQAVASEPATKGVGTRLALGGIASGNGKEHSNEDSSLRHLLDKRRCD